MEKPLAQKAGHGLAGQAHQSGQPRIRLLAVPGLDLHHPGTAAGRSGSGSLRQLPRLPGHLPHQRLSRALPARCAALHFLSHHRAQGPDPARIPRSDGQPHLWLRRLPGGLPLEQIRPERARDATSAARGIERAAPGRAGAAGRCGVSRAVPQIAGQAHRPRPLPAQCADRHRQQRRRRAGATKRTRCWTILRRWCAARRCGRCSGCCRATEFAALAAHRSSREADATVRAEWNATA